MLRERDEIQDKESLTAKVERLENEYFDGSHNYDNDFPYSTRHGLLGWDLFFRGDYLYPRTVEAIHDVGFEIVSFHIHDLEDFRPNADMKVRVREKTRE